MGDFLVNLLFMIISSQFNCKYENQGHKVSCIHREAPMTENRCNTASEQGTREEPATVTDLT